MIIIILVILNQTSWKRKDFTTIPRKNTAGQAATKGHEGVRKNTSLTLERRLDPASQSIPLQTLERAATAPGPPPAHPPGWSRAKLRNGSIWVTAYDDIKQTSEVACPCKG